MLTTPTVTRTTNVLILCTHNSARSVLSEGTLNHWAKQLSKDMHTYSAGSTPSDRLNPFAPEALTNAGIGTAGHRNESWSEFVGDGAAQIRIVITVCDSTAAEACPYWPGSPVKVYWDYADPSGTPGSDEGKRQALELTRQATGYRMLQLLTLPLDTLSNTELQAALERIAQA